MKLKNLNCPQCGANLENDKELKVLFCQYCGQKIVVEENIHELDAKVKLRNMEHEEIMQQREHEQERYKIKKEEQKEFINSHKDTIGIVVVFAVVLIMFLVMGIVLMSSKIESGKEEKQLQQLVDEIMADIDEQDYNSAYIKAKKLRYTSGYSSDVEKKWDETREALLKRIAEEGGIGVEEETKGLIDKILDKINNDKEE